MMGRLLMPIAISAAVVIPGIFYLGHMATAQFSMGISAAPESPLTVDFGVLRQGESATHRCWLRNRTQASMEIRKFKSSCECVSAVSEMEIIPPGERALLTVAFDGTHDTEFTGPLSVAVGIEGPSTEPIGYVTVNVEVFGTVADSCK